ncbi:MAG: ABC transporter substrate-binding protein [Piscinibacter sp.]
MSDLAAVLQDLAPTGRVRAAINFGNPVLAHPDKANGEPTGVSVDLAREIAARLGVGIELVTFDAAGKVTAAVKTGVWDIAFLAIDPARAVDITFTAPYVVIEGSYIVREDSPLRFIDDFDRADIRIAVGRGAAYDLFLSRALKQAKLVRADTSAGAVDLFVDSGLDAAAGVRQPLLAYAEQTPGFRVIPGRFTVIEQAVCAPRGREAGVVWLRSFVEEMKACGFVAAALERHQQRDAAVAPPADRGSPI